MSQTVPLSYALCLNEGCAECERCLRHVALDYVAEGQDRISVIHPKRYPVGGKACPFFRPDEKTELVWGIKEILENIPVKASENVKAAMIARYGKTRFYRFWRNELPLRPEERAYFERVLLKNEVSEPPEYGRTETCYLWK